MAHGKSLQNAGQPGHARSKAEPGVIHRNSNVLAIKPKCLSHKVNSNPNHTVPLFSKGDYFGMNEYLLNVNFDFYLTCTDIEFLWSFLNSPFRGESKIQERLGTAAHRGKNTEINAFLT